MSQEQRRDISNGIWLCVAHSREIDRDMVKYTAALLKQFKAAHEQFIANELTAGRGDTGNQEVRARAVRSVRQNAEQLEDFAIDCYHLVKANTKEFEVSLQLPKIPPCRPTGDDSVSLDFESRYSDLAREIEAANRNIDEIANDGYHTGTEEGLLVLESRAWRIAKMALTLARDYRSHFGLSRASLSGREQAIEEEIFDRAAADE
ncbi:TPA: hypothetical protein ACU967_006135 [Burkholderia contaminans]|nr:MULTISPECIES: hypothetical protein [Burkholderia]MBM6430737.1 hypothetical protein [Burkholderia contaminans]MBR8015189.1 hypothetical protein [Burkholderia vietnamiensis]MCA7881037.1 hypothetical protein [Burkholderia contaminans]MCB4348993.1 hypothetical protein [Burkholderia vietnamiensis]MDN8026086.1 hypothetical protein [Burkholderia contaminans]